VPAVTPSLIVNTAIFVSPPFSAMLFSCLWHNNAVKSHFLQEEFS
jgi:hypothetical protein